MGSRHKLQLLHSGLLIFAFTSRHIERASPPPAEPYAASPCPAAAGLCNSTANVATIQQLRADIIAQSGATDLAIFCVDTPASAGRRLQAATNAVYTASVCTPDRNYIVPLSERTGDRVGCVPVLPPMVSAPAACLRAPSQATLVGLRP